MEKHFAVIGDPIAHSLSPAMHNGAYRRLGLKAEYHRFKVSTDNLGDAVKGLCALGFSGWNVTIPHKENIIPFLDEMTEQAQRAGAVNTVRVQEGKLIGHNTDGLGFLHSLHIPYEQVKGKRVVILGAGGAAKGIAMALANLGSKIHILNRSIDKADLLAATINSVGGQATAGLLVKGNWIKDVDLLVQTTPIGLNNEDFLLSLDGISPSTVVVDIILRPWDTPFMIEAKKHGCRTHNGLGMLLHQGALAWEFWFENPAPIDIMHEELSKALYE